MLGVNIDDEHDAILIVALLLGLVLHGVEVGVLVAVQLADTIDLFPIGVPRSRQAIGLKELVDLLHGDEA